MIFLLLPILFTLHSVLAALSPLSFSSLLSSPSPLGPLAGNQFTSNSLDRLLLFSLSFSLTRSIFLFLSAHWLLCRTFATFFFTLQIQFDFLPELSTLSLFYPLLCSIHRQREREREREALSLFVRHVIASFHPPHTSSCIKSILHHL